MRARGCDPELDSATRRHDDDRRRAVVQRAGVAGGDLAARLERGLERSELLVGRRSPRAVVGLDPVVRRDLPREESGVLGRDRALLGLLREPVHVLARDVPALGDVLRGEAHRDVDVRDRRVVSEEGGMELFLRLRVPAHL